MQIQKYMHLYIKIKYTFTLIYALFCCYCSYYYYSFNLPQKNQFIKKIFMNIKISG